MGQYSMVATWHYVRVIWCHSQKTERCHGANFVITAPQIVVVTTCGASSDDKASIMTTLGFQRLCNSVESALSLRMAWWILGARTSATIMVTWPCGAHQEHRHFHSLLYIPNGRQIACREGCARGLSVTSENDWNSHRLRESTIHCDRGNPQLYLDKPITKGLDQSMKFDMSHILLTVAKLCNSLVMT